MGLFDLYRRPRGQGTTARASAWLPSRKAKVAAKVTKTVHVPLSMPTEITAQNGAVLRQNTKIVVEGCPKPKKRAAKKGRRGE